MKASVIICTYNRSALLRDSIRSVQTQDFPPDQFEIIVVDNNSTDDTKKVVEESSASSQIKIKYVFEAHQGLSYARNTGIENAEGDIIVFTDDDIEADTSWLRELVSVFGSADAFAAGGPIRPIWAGERPDWLTDEWVGYLTVSEFLSARETGEFKGPNYPWGANIAFRKEVFKTVGMFPADLGRTGASLLSSEEVNLCRKIEASGKRILFSPDAVIHHKIPADRLKELWFYHRTFWQGRSEAISDMQIKGDVYARLKELTAQLTLDGIYYFDQGFQYTCTNRLVIGYLFQLLQLQNEESDFRNLRVLNTFTSAAIRTARLDHVRKEIEHALQLAEKDRRIEALLTSWSWKITAPLRWFISSFLRKK